MYRLITTVLRQWIALLGLSLSLLAPVANAAAPTSFEFHDTSGTVSVNYATTSFVGVPTLSYVNGSTSLSFSGDQIQVQETAIGQLVTVTVAIHPDVDFQTLSLLIPHVNLFKTPVNVSTRAILTTHRTPFVVPFIGQREIYQQVIGLKGVASFIQF